MKKLENIKKVDYNKRVIWKGKFPMCREKMNGTRLNPSAFLTNLRVDMPLSKKLCFIFKNQWIKIKNLQSCCDHPGEPGC